MCVYFHSADPLSPAQQPCAPGGGWRGGSQLKLGAQERAISVPRLPRLLLLMIGGCASILKTPVTTVAVLLIEEGRRGESLSFLPHHHPHSPFFLASSGLRVLPVEGVAESERVADNED